MGQLRRRFLAFALFAAVGVVLVAKVVSAQDPVEVAPHIYTVLFENERVRVSKMHFKPGDSIAPHSHPDHFVYVLSAGALKISRPDGTSQEFVGEPGQVVWIDAETHWAENVGTTDLEAIVVELKEAPTQPAAATIQ